MKINLVGLGRLVAAASRIAKGMWIVATQFPKLAQPERDAHIQRWSHQMLAALDIELKVEGRYDPSARLIVANHVSWLDILVINAAQPVRFVGKSELKSWPILGWLITNTGTVFIERARRKDAVRVVHHMAEVIRGGQLVAIFPEGTTGPGHEVLPFHANLLQAAVAAESPVQPVALRYSDALHDVSVAAAYVSETNIWQSLWRVAMAHGLQAHVALLAAQPPGRERRVLADALSQAIAQRLQAHGAPASTQDVSHQTPVPESLPT